MVMGLLGEHGVGKIGIVGVGARAVPYTSFEGHVGRSRSPWEGERMREVEGLRVRGVSEVGFCPGLLPPADVMVMERLMGMRIGEMGRFDGEFDGEVIAGLIWS